LLTLAFNIPPFLISENSLNNIHFQVPPWNKLIHFAREFASNHTLPPLKEKKYALTLRRASDEGSYLLVDLLLRWKDKLGINMNEPSANGNTALEWAERSQHADKTKIIECLISHGVKSGKTAVINHDM
jgi:ankyrin repeat protein